MKKLTTGTHTAMAMYTFTSADLTKTLKQFFVNSTLADFGITDQEYENVDTVFQHGWDEETVERLLNDRKVHDKYLREYKFDKLDTDSVIEETMNEYWEGASWGSAWEYPEPLKVSKELIARCLLYSGANAVEGYTLVEYLEYFKGCRGYQETTSGNLVDFLCAISTKDMMAMDDWRF